MATHDALYPLILPDVPQCAFPTVDTAINRAAQEFCRDSLCWADTQTVSLLPNVREYAITVPDDADLVVDCLVGIKGKMPGKDDILHRLQHRFMLPARDAAIVTGGAARLQRAARTG